MKTIKTYLALPLLLWAALSVPAALAKENPGAKKPATQPPTTTAAGCSPATDQIDLYINNVRATLLNGGDMWWDLSNSGYEVPAGSNKHSMFAGSLWIGGIDGSGNLKVAAQTYRQTGLDYWPGAIDTTTVDILASRCLYYDRFWKVNRQEVQDFIQNGTTTADILSWPGNGDPLYNEGHFLAPFVDVNADGTYDPSAGDYPGYNFSGVYPTVPGTISPVCNDYLFGDQSIWWVINDVGNIHTETSSDPIGLEIRCQAFAYQSSQEAINNATFYKYQVINRSSFTYDEMYFGQWADPDLGNYTDDYVGCDVPLGLGYCYNGDANDDGAAGYGIDPPVVGIDFMQGPVADQSDNIDNDKDGCVDCTFIDSAGVILIVPDYILPEQIIMSKFVYYNNLNGSPTGNPINMNDFFNYLRGYWLDNQPITYGGNGRLGSAGNTGVVCDYMFPDDTDPDFQLPTYQPWSEGSSGNVPEDRRFLMSAGEFTMEPGEVNFITTAVLWARQTGGGPLGSLTLLQQYNSQVQQLFDHCFDTTAITGIEVPHQEFAVSVFPNPASEFVIFEMERPEKEITIEVFSSSGQLVMKSVTSERSFRWDSNTVQQGIYIYRISAPGMVNRSGKLVLR
jgi:hypothetical protein